MSFIFRIQGPAQAAPGWGWERIRPWPVYLMAAMAPVGLAPTNIAKAFVLIAALACALFERRASTWDGVRILWSPRLVAAAIGLFALSVSWSSVPAETAWASVGKHASKLFIIPACLVLLRSERQAWVALFTWMASQSFVMLSSWLLWVGVQLPWAAPDRNSVATVFSSYLDQSMLTGLLALVLWALAPRFQWPGMRRVAKGLSLIAALNVMIALPGRSGQVGVLIGMVIVLWWTIPVRHRWLALAAPLAAIAIGLSASEQFRERSNAVLQEASAYRAGERSSSSGLRLDFWRHSLAAIKERPWSGYGAGSWNHAYRNMAGTDMEPSSGGIRNPHQEYLLWSVEIGVAGALLLAGLLLAIGRDAKPFPSAIRHAAQAAAAYVAVVCLVNSALYDAVTGETFCLVLGMLLAAGHCTRSSPTNTSQHA